MTGPIGNYLRHLPVVLTMEMVQPSQKQPTSTDAQPPAASRNKRLPG
ncbi:hypothetical protein AB0M46_49165 [Dactylosporangium sp. NPDC051485]